LLRGEDLFPLELEQQTTEVPWWDPFNFAVGGVSGALSRAAVSAGRSVVVSVAQRISSKGGRLSGAAGEVGALGPGAARAGATARLETPELLRGLEASEIDDIARMAGYEIRAGKTTASNPATRYYVPGTRGSVGFRVLPRGVRGQAWD
jgi:hypothetical protein